jgi:hypothetical protein
MTVENVFDLVHKIRAVVSHHMFPLVMKRKEVSITVDVCSDLKRLIAEEDFVNDGRRLIK